MPYRIVTSEFSFVQFNETDEIVDCEFTTEEMCLPVFDVNDVWFQFIIESDTEEESNALCVLGADEPIALGLVEACGDPYKIQFVEKPTRYRVSPTRVLYVWEQGLPNFFNYIEVGQCFHIMVSKPTIDDQTFCSNCFQRIFEDCHTTVLEYTNEENAFGFNYCAGEDLGQDVAECEPTIIEFTNQTNLTIPWTAWLQAKYGITPNIQAWILDNGELVAAGIRIALDSLPPTEIRLDFGGLASGFVKIM
jgi:hypothetical protein